MFKKKVEQPEPKPYKMPKYITVISVHNIPKQKVKTTYGHYGHGESYTESQMEQTVVLYVDFNGVLKTKTFEGKWTLEEANKWTVERVEEEE